MVCKQLGYTRAENYYSRSHFGSVSEDFSYGYVNCAGYEKNIEDCRYNDNFEDYKCGRSDGAGVVCSHDSGTTTASPELEDYLDKNCEYT